MSTKIFIYAALILVGLGALLIWQSQQIGKFRLIACNVGQGDALLLIAPRGQQIVVDGGPNNKVVDCLAQHMPFWDRKVEVVVNTHPQQDHLQGLTQVLKDYEVELVVRTPVGHTTELYKSWQMGLESAKIKTHNPVTGQTIVVGGLYLEILWPDQEHLDLWRLSPPSDLNETSIVMRVNFPKTAESSGTNCIYLTGDINVEILERLIDKPCDILKVAHHGSRTGTTDALLAMIKPKIALMQLGAKNRYKHPHKEVMDVFSKFGVKVLRNDLNGEIEVDSDGKSWSVKKNR